MTNNIDLLNLCLEDSLFAALYEALCNLENKWHTSSPVDMWIEALSARQKLSKSRRPDLLLRQLFVGSNPNEAVVVKPKSVIRKNRFHFVLKQNKRCILC